VLPGGRNSGQKLKRGWRKKKLAGRICGRVLQKMTMTKFNDNFVDPSAERCSSFYVKIGRTFSRIGRTFSRIGRTFFMYWQKYNFRTWQHWQQHTHRNS
jgi:hypothetical protein